jgi:hypothetical protein
MPRSIGALDWGSIREAGSAVSSRAERSPESSAIRSGRGWSSPDDASPDDASLDDASLDDAALDDATLDEVTLGDVRAMGREVPRTVGAASGFGATSGAAVSNPTSIASRWPELVGLVRGSAWWSRTAHHPSACNVAAPTNATASRLTLWRRSLTRLA